MNVTPESRKGRPNSDGGTACVVGKTDSGKFHVSYIVDRKISKEVHPSRLNESTIQTLSRSTRGGKTSPVPQTSLLDPKLCITRVTSKKYWRLSALDS